MAEGSTRRGAVDRAGRRARRAALVGTVSLLVFSGGLVSSGALGSPAAGASPSSLVTVGTRAALPAGAKAAGPLAADTRLSLDVALKPADSAALARFAAAVSSPSSSQYGHYLGKGQFASRFGAPASEIAALRAGLSADGLTVTGTSPDGLLLHVSGTAAKVSAALHVSLETYHLRGGRTVFANTDAPSVPSGIAPDLLGIVGLSDVAQRVPEYRLPSMVSSGTDGSHATGATPAAVTPQDVSTSGGPQACPAVAAEQSLLAKGGFSGLAWTQVARTYDFTAAYTDGNFGQTASIAFFELSPYTATDLTTFEQCYAFATGTYGPVFNIAVDGGAGSGAGTPEPILDVEDARVLAPEAAIYMYEAPNTTLGLLTNYDTIVTDDTAQVISSSWGECEAYEPPVVTGITNEIFEEAATQGQSVFIASGDEGSEGCHYHDTSATPTTTTVYTQTQTTQISAGSAMPYATVVGGTELDGFGGTYAPQEVAWGTATRQIGSTGGVSFNYAKPAWQTTGRTPATVPGPVDQTGTCTVTPLTSTVTTTSCRQVPDVSANADPTIGGDIIYCNNQGQYCTTTLAPTHWSLFGGTSDAAPLWASLTALADNSCPAPAGFINPRLYQLGDTSGAFHDVTSGTNDVTGVHPGFYTAGPGYDDVTGLGSPDGSALLSDLCPAQVSAASVHLSTDEAGASASYTVQFTTGGGTLPAGGTITLSAPEGTTFPLDPHDYTVTGVTVTLAAPLPSTRAETPSTTDNSVTLTLPGPVGTGTDVTVEAQTVTNDPTAGSYELEVSTSLAADPTPAPFSIQPATPSATRSTVTPATPSVGLSTTDDVTVTVTDAFGNPVPGVEVTLSATATATATAVTGTGESATSTSGTAVFDVASTVAQTVHFDATVVGVTPALPIDATATVDFSDISLSSLAPGDPRAGATSTLTAVFSTPHGLDSGETLTVSGPAGDTLPASRSDYHVTQGSTIAVSAVAVAEGDGSATDNVATVTLGGAISAATPVDLEVDGTTEPTTSGPAVFGIATQASPVAAQKLVDIEPAAIDPSNSSVTPSHLSAPATGITGDTVFVTARDRFGNPVAGVTVEIATTGQELVLATPPVEPTDATGQTEFVVADPTVQLATATVRSTTGTTIGSTTISFTGIMALTYTVVTSLTTFQPDTTAGATVAFEAFTELSGAIPPGGRVTFSAPAGTSLPSTPTDFEMLNSFSKVQAIAGMTVSEGPGSTTTNVVTFTLTKDTRFKTKSMYLILLGVTVRNPVRPGTGYASVSATGTGNKMPSYSNAITFHVGAPSAATSTITATPTVTQVGQASTVTVTVRDGVGNPIATQPVTLHADHGAVVAGDGSTPLTAATSTTGPTGAAVFSVTDNTVTTVNLSATVAGAALSGSVRFAHGTYVSGVTVSPASVPAGGASTYTVQFTTSSTGAIGPTSTISIVGPSGTAWPSGPGTYTVTGTAAAKVSGTGTAQHPLVVTLGATHVGDSAAATVVVAHVVDPTTPSTGDTLSVATSADTTPTTSNQYSVVAVPTTGYDLVGADGGVFVFNAPGQKGGYYGSLPEMGISPVAPIVGMVPTANDAGYFLVGADGGVFAFGNAPFLGSSDQIDPALPPGGPNSFVPAAPITGIVAADTDKGYYLVGQDGGVFAFGTVPYLGSLPGKGISVDDIVGIASTPSGDGYWLIGATGAVYAFGSAQPLGAASGLGSPVAAIAGTPTGHGYWVSAQDGAVEAFGNATDFGSLPALGVTPDLPVVGVVPIDGTGGYWLIGATGGVYAFGNAGFVGSLPGLDKAVTDIVGAVPN